jgi:hypothetical protein
MQFDIRNRWTGVLQFSADIACDEDTPLRIKIGLAVKWAYKSDADLSGADLRDAHLRDAHLRGADLRGADLSGADLSDAHLRGADLRGAVLSGADLSDAVLRGADLRDAVLSGADLSDADLREFKVDGKIGIINAGSPNHWHAFGYVDQSSQTLRLHVGCRRFSLSEGRAYWTSEAHPDRDNRREVLAALDYIETVARLRGWTGEASAKSEAA